MHPHATATGVAIIARQIGQGCIGRIQTVAFLTSVCGAMSTTFAGLRYSARPGLYEVLRCVLPSRSSYSVVQLSL